ncbi:unnamed protein product [Urochloa decumbens]|uniref:Response regulatory domain-containing protein n=1 Tax=Urochloa decumbens TaxID=240449 RepID=A0ABC9CYA1_9POAL
MGTQRTEGPSSAKLSVIVVDEDLCHANTASCMLAKLDFKVMVYTSPVEALKFLQDHGKAIDFALVAMNMKEMHGFQFLDISRESHKNLQVILMSDDITWPTMKRSVEIGAQYLVKKPVDENSINNLWQHLDQNLHSQEKIKFHIQEKIKELFQGIQGKRDAVFNSKNKYREGASKQKVSQLMWTPFLQKKFLQALELLGEAATAKTIQLIMNVKSIGRKQISTHLQKHRKKMDKKLRDKNARKWGNGASNSQPLRICETGPNTCQYDPEMKPEYRTDGDMSWDQTECNEETQDNNVYEAMRTALKFGTIFDESQLLNDLPVNQASKGEVDMNADRNGRGDWTYVMGDKVVVSETHNACNAKGLMEKDDSDTEDAQGRVSKIVDYSDSEDDEGL